MRSRNILQYLFFFFTLILSHIALADITVTGHGEVKIAPTIASFNITVETTAQTAKEAADRNAGQSTKTIELLKTLITEDKAISTENYSMYPEYNYNNTTNTNDFKGFKAINSINVKTKDIANLGTLLDKIIASGITTISALNFSHDNPEKIYQEALSKAFANSSERAEVLAKASGVALKGVKSINIINAEFGTPRPVAMSHKTMMMEASATPTEAPDVTTSATIEVIFKT